MAFDEMEAHAAEMQRRDDLAFVNNIEVGLRAIAGLRLDDLPKTGGKLARLRLEYAICCAKDTLTRSGLSTVGPRLAAEQQAVTAEMKANGNKLPTSWQQERLTRARNADRGLA
jgi:hypothetical protein